MKQILDGLTNEQTLHFTNALANSELAKRRGTDNDTITDQNRDAFIREAEQSARAYAEARNRNASPRSLIGEDASLVASVKKWVTNRGKRLRG